jgi:hypothetical protein
MYPCSMKWDSCVGVREGKVEGHTDGRGKEENGVRVDGGCMCGSS